MWVCVRCYPQAWDQEIIRCQGLDPLVFDFVVLKSAVHFRGHFTEIASHIVEVTGPGIHSSRLSDFAFQHVRRPLFPIDGYFDSLGDGGGDSEITAEVQQPASKL